jgi:nicotinamide-nucleotide amidase
MRVQQLADAVATELDGRSLATAESFTAGRLGAAFAAVASASEWFRGGLIAYQVPVKRELLAVRSYSVVTTHAACEMARGAADLFHADVTLSTTGVAGGEPVDGVPGGTAMFAAYVDGLIEVRRTRFEGSPEAICDQAATAALLLLLTALRNGNSTAATTRAFATTNPGAHLRDATGRAVDG